MTEDTWDESDAESSEAHSKNVRIHKLNMNRLHLRTPLRTVQRYHCAPIRVLCDLSRYINLRCSHL